MVDGFETVTSGFSLEAVAIDRVRNFLWHNDVTAGGVMACDLMNL